MSPSSLSASNAADGSVAFDGGFTFSQPGTYLFTLSENAGSADGVTYDTATYTATAEVTDNGDGSSADTGSSSDTLPTTGDYLPMAAAGAAALAAVLMAGGIVLRHRRQR